MLHIIFTLFFLLPPSLEAMPAEKRAQMCFVMQDALEPQVPQWWRLGKISTSALIGLGAALAVSHIDPTPRKSFPQVRRFNQLVQVHTMLTNARTKFSPKTVADDDTPFTLPEIPAAPSLLQAATFFISGIATYFLLTLCTDQFVKPHTATLKAFLADWPDYAFYAPQTLREEAASLYGAYLRQGDAALGDEHTAALILQAFNIFLTEEIQLISHTLQ